MKRFIITNTIFLLIFASSCSSDTDDSEDFIPEPDPTIITYSNSVKNIINSKCTECHGTTPSQGAIIALTSSSLVKNAINNNNLIGRIEDGSMPPVGSLSTAQITAIKNWQTGGFKP